MTVGTHISILLSLVNATLQAQFRQIWQRMVFCVCVCVCVRERERERERDRERKRVFGCVFVCILKGECMAVP